jgi:hypothetical protein
MDGNALTNVGNTNPGGFPIVVLDRFIQSTRDSGYKDTASAISELVDNALQANARRVKIQIEGFKTDEGNDYRVIVTDDGDGMDDGTLAQALRFGGTSRFNNRSGLGRFGMGLPNASLSQARRVEVYTWQFGQNPKFSFLDVDEIVSGKLDLLPTPVEANVPAGIEQVDETSGTVIIWEKCDRLDNRRVSTIERKLIASLGRRFRFYLWTGVQVFINEIKVEPIDPLYLSTESDQVCATVYDEPVEFEIYASPDSGDDSYGKVKVTFSELPIHAWKDLAQEEKRRLGVANGAGVSIVRAGREVDFGWFFLTGKRRENYDDWWRCEIKFEPVLDDAFGITHTKQQIRPKEHLVEALQSYIEETAKALNSRVRGKFAKAKESAAFSGVEEIAKKRDARLKPLPKAKVDPNGKSVLENLRRKYPDLLEDGINQKILQTRYRIVEDHFESTNFYEPIYEKGSVVAVINPRHAFARQLYEPLKGGADPQLSQAIQLMLLASARAEASFTRKSEREVLKKYREEWSIVLEALLKP